MTLKVRLFRDASAGGGGFVGISDILGGDGTEKATDITTVATEEETKTDPVEGLNPDGTLQEGYEKDADGNVVKIDPGTGNEENGEEEQEETTDEPQEDYWEVVEKITGRKLEVALPEGLTAGTPEAAEWLTSPEGTAARINAEREDAAVAFENYIKENNPRAYAFMLHLEAGGTEEDFFSDNRGLTLPTLEELGASGDVQAQMYKYDLINIRGLDEDAAQALVDKAIKDNKLKERAETAWKTLDTAQKQQLADLQKQKEDENKSFETAVQNMSATLQKQIKEAIGFVVPETEQATFQKYVTENLRYDNGKFYVVQEVGQDPKTLLESLLYQYKKGDLKSLVERTSKTKAAQVLRLKVKNNNSGPGTGAGASKSAPKHVPLGSIL